MRKFVIGLIAGALLMFSTQAFGAEIKSFIGKKIQGEYAVYVDGKPLDVKAIGANGSTFTPNRALADAVGYDIKFVDQKVYFTKKGVASVDPANNNDGEELAMVNARIKELIELDTKFRGQVKELEQDYAKDPDGAKKKYEALEAQMKPLREEHEALMKRKAELEAQQ